MTGQRLDTEQVIRDWLADSTPGRAPASLKAALEEATSRPAGQVRLGPRVGRHTLLLATRIAAAAAILAIAASSIYLYNSNRAILPAGWPSDSALPSASPAASSPAGSPSGSASPAGTSWRLVSGALPQMIVAQFELFRSPIFALSTGGFLAFVPDMSAVPGRKSDGRVLAAPASVGPSVAPTSSPTRVFQSGDGSDWSPQSDLPTLDATVSAVTESGGRVVAVGFAGNTPDEIPMAWSTTDLQTWQAATPPTQTSLEARGVAAGPAGFLAWGNGNPSTEFWISSDGVAWRSLKTSGLPTDATVDELYATPGGYAIRGFLSDRAAVWQSSDGATWTQAWTGPGPSGMEFYAMGPIAKAPDGGYVSFGTAGMAPGGAAAAPYDLLRWTSTDMIHWTLSGRIGRPGWMDDFAAVPGGFVTAGAQPAAGDAGVTDYGSLSVWTSTDGRAWQAVRGLPSIAGIEVLAVVGNGQRAVIVCVDQQGNLQLLVGNGLK
jgi:hypothetical protein